jgi:hypothetical protein
VEAADKGIEKMTVRTAPAAAEEVPEQRGTTGRRN